ncbi:MAG: metallophosphoesterase [Candidatus Thermoplasmatota archaeon]
MKPAPVHGDAALLLKGTGALAVADMHIGVEHEIGGMGVTLPSQTEAMVERLKALAREAKVRRIVVVGDLKHNLPRSSRQERLEVPRLLAHLHSHFADIHLARGNHDGGIEPLLPGYVRVHPATGLRLGRYGICHGHSWPSEEVMGAETLVIAHSHPVVMLRDRLGRSWSERCWLRTTFRGGERYPGTGGEAIVLPAYNPYCRGHPCNIEGEGLIGPLFRHGVVDLNAAEIYLLDGTFLGKRRQLLLRR